MICSAVSFPKSAGPSRPGKAAPAEEGPDESQCALGQAHPPHTRVPTAGTESPCALGQVHLPHTRVPTAGLTFLQELGPQRGTLRLPFQLKMFHWGSEGPSEGRQGVFIQVLALQRQHGRRLTLVHCSFENQHVRRCISLTQARFSPLT